MLTSRMECATHQSTIKNLNYYTKIFKIALENESLYFVAEITFIKNS
jgi:hypothetical protein